MDQTIGLTAKTEVFVNGQIILQGAPDRKVVDRGSQVSKLFLTSPWQAASWSMRSWDSACLQRMLWLGADSQDRMDQIVTLAEVGLDQVNAGNIVPGVSM